jgi:RecB family endonuclease NucS
MEQLKEAIDGESMIKRIKYRKQVGNYMAGKKPVVAKGEIFKQEHAHAEHIEENLKNEKFGFKCLHYSVSEASGSLDIIILNKSGKASSVYVKTIEADSKAGKDYEHYEGTLEFKNGESSKLISIKIIDDDNWEPDKDFFI